MTIDITFLKSIAYFTMMNATELEAIKLSFSEKNISAGWGILLEGNLSDTLFFVAAGAVKVFKTSAQGKEQILSIARPGEALTISLFLTAVRIQLVRRLLGRLLSMV